MDPSRCVVLTPIDGYLEPECARGLAQLEARGYHVRTLPRYAAIDQGRSRMATDAMLADYEALMWIDSNIGFEADAVDMLREHDLPVVCGIHPHRDTRELACNLLPGTSGVTFGAGGGLLEIRYTAMGFCYTQRAVYEQMIVREKLPVCNKQFEHIMVPYFLPLLLPQGETDHWYMSPEYSFCERARRSGFTIMADTRIRLEQIGSHSYFWEEAGTDRRRYATYEFTLH